MKIKAAHILVHYSSVPYTKIVKDIAKSVLDHNNFLVKEIREMLMREDFSVVVNKPIYQLKNITISCLNDLKIVIKRIIYFKQPSMVEDVYKLCQTGEEKNLADTLLIKHFILKGAAGKALEIFDKIPINYLSDILEELYLILEFYINNKKCFPKQCENHYLFLKRIQKRAASSLKSLEQRIFIDRFKTLEGVYKLWKEFDFDWINISDLKNRKEIIKKELINFLMEEENIEQLVGKTAEVSEYLKVEKEEIFVKIAQISSLNRISEIGKYIFDNCMKSKYLCIYSTLILQNLSVVDLSSSILNTSGNFSFCEMQAVNISDYQKAVKLAGKLAVKGWIYSNEDIIEACEVYNWARWTFLISETEDREVDFGSIQPLNLFITIRDVFIAYSSYMKAQQEPNTKYLAYFNSPSQEEDLLNYIQILPEKIQNLCSEGQPYLAYKLVMTFKHGLIYAPNLVKAKEMLSKILMEQCFVQILDTIFSSDAIDIELGFALLIFHDESYAWQLFCNILKRYKKNLNKFESLAKLGLLLIRHFNLPVSKEGKLHNILLSIKWWRCIPNTSLGTYVMNFVRVNFNKFSFIKVT